MPGNVIFSLLPGVIDEKRKLFNFTHNSKDKKMRKVLIGGVVVVVAALIIAFAYSDRTASASAGPAQEGNSQAIHWYTWEEAIAASEQQPKKFFIDVYTDWCGWCKKMDATTFADPQVAEYMNQNFYPVKLDAEQKEDIVFDGHTFKYIQSGSRGVHELAYALLDGQLGFPSYVYLNEKRQRITVSPGYKPVSALMQEMQTISGQY